MEEKKYLVIDTFKNKSCGDEFIEAFDTPEEATKEAKSQWEHLTISEQKTRHIYSCYVTKEDLLDGAIDENGKIDWSFNAGGRYYKGYFDSEKIKEE